MDGKQPRLWPRNRPSTSHQESEQPGQVQSLESAIQPSSTHSAGHDMIDHAQCKAYHEHTSHRIEKRPLSRQVKAVSATHRSSTTRCLTKYVVHTQHDSTNKRDRAIGKYAKAIRQPSARVHYMIGQAEYCRCSCCTSSIEYAANEPAQLQHSTNSLLTRSPSQLLLSSGKLGARVGKEGRQRGTALGVEKWLGREPAQLQQAVNLTRRFSP